jgi:hypothetical protein
MTLHDPEMEVSCNERGCTESVYLPMGWSLGGYDIENDRAEILLSDDHNWLTVAHEHYCCEHRSKHEHIT